MTTYFDTVSRSYADVTTTDGINTSEFLQASEGLVKLFDIIGNPAFTVVQNDLNGNIKKVRTRLLATPEVSSTLQDLVHHEGKPGDKKRPATEGLMWLLRGLDFTAQALRRLTRDPKEELSPAFTNAYSQTLSKHHSFIVRGVFSVAMKACPYRAEFYLKLGSPTDRVEAELEKWLAALESIVTTMTKYYADGNYGKGL
ncbi:unnamed protein product [Tilletia controversa]|uniref:Glycolipid transfer protein domain-containing protein n=3 Tax=Tilletia TaxID=13289 RepID=A0A8X7MLY8_9BASI|nr:hypothetical protein CF336_g3753 [Tilletia laevis]KAE8197747.1 hypothetical protein CF328_g3760 [Tilletia controversa]KAE8257302.1 hypothetical protein A4X03_0g4713 [Tilletia caries]KAE8203585.1 hypothetical protein CF335_g2964 [Tilletia laevis]KAE8239994.1 hypothetical protein A4X06_0g7947 [Tilletia controversa]